MANLSGQSLGRYQILEQLGESRMAVVYRAFDTRIDAYLPENAKAILSTNIVFAVGTWAGDASSGIALDRRA